MLLRLCEITSEHITHEAVQCSSYNDPCQKEKEKKPLRIKYKGHIFPASKELKRFGTR